MSTELKVQQEIFQAMGVEVRNHPFGTIVFFNVDLVPTKLIDILCKSLDDADFDVDGHGIFSVVFRDDGYPVDSDETLNSWMFFPDACAAVCNIQHCIKLAIQDTQNPEIEHSEKASVYMGVWKNMLKGFFHETWHAHSAIIEPEKLRFDETYRTEDEEEAPIFARQQLIAMAKIMDIEPEFTPNIQLMIDEAVAEEISLIEETKDAEEHLKAWVFYQKHLISNGGVFYDPAKNEDEDDVYIKSLKEFLHMLSGDAEDDPEWNAETIANPGTMVAEPLTTNIANANTIIDEDLPWETENSETEILGFQGVNTFNQPQQPMATTVSTPVAPTGPSAPTAPIAPTGPSAPTGVNPAAVVNGKVYEPITLPAGVDAKTVVYGLYLKIFNHIFQGCQYNPTNQQMPFTGSGNIANWITLDANEAMFVKEMTCYSNDGAQKLPATPVDNAISGILIDKAGTLPGYELTLSMPDGTQAKRKFIPQNPNKAVNGTLTSTAQMAKNGNQILWIIDPDTKGYGMRVLNGVIQQNVNGQWV